MTEQNKEDADMTTKEREEWLKERGVQIVNRSHEEIGRGSSSPNDETCTVSILDQMAGLQLPSVEINNNSSGSIQFVCIPQDESKPIKTLSLPEELARLPGDSLSEYVRPHFADNKSIDSSLLKQQATKHFAAGNFDNLVTDPTNISTSTMNSVAAQGSVETFPLVRPADTNGFQGVNIYLDEVGMLKKLPINTRASTIAASCGYHPAPNFYGDVFVGRVQSKPTIQNLDFVAGVDTDRGAAWMQRAVSENFTWQQEFNQLTGKVGQLQPSAAGADGVVATEANFTWTQDDDEVEITVPFDSDVNKRLVKVSFLSKSVAVQYDGEAHLSVQLYSSIDLDGCTWTVDGSSLVITCEKVESGIMWPRVSS